MYIYIYIYIYMYVYMYIRILASSKMDGGVDLEVVN